MSLNKILVATNLTERSERALARALQLKSDALILLHVVPAGLPPELAAEQQKAAETFLAHRLRYEGSERASDRSHNVLTGSAFSTIIAEAISSAAELIVIGKPGTRPFSELFTGTTAERVIRFSDRPVLMVKKPESGPYRRVLVGRKRQCVRFEWLWQLHLMRSSVSSTRGGHLMCHSAISKRHRRQDNPYIVVANQSSWADLLAMGTHSKGLLASTVSIGKLARHLLIEASCDVLTSRP
jgi:nucleotide-binding universal stress UspA family protein